MIFICSLSIYVYGQDTTEVVPDGTEGVTMEVGKLDSTVTLGNWNEFDGPGSSLKIGGGFLYEFAGYIQDEASKEQISMKSQFKVRDFRFTMSGLVKSERFISWKLGIMFDGATNSWFMRETGVMVGIPELWGYVFVGRTKEGFSMNKVMNGYAGWTMERQMALDVIPILADGIKLMGFIPEKNIFWNVGIYSDWLSEPQSFSTYNWQFAIRAGWLPIYSEAGSTILHLGINYRYGEIEGDAIRVRSKPEANPAPYFIDTDTFQSDFSNHLGYEI